MARLASALLLACLLLPGGQVMAQTPTAASSEGQAFPTQLQLRVPQGPTAFRNGANTYLVYELHLTNFSAAPMRLSRIDVLDAAAPKGKPVATFSSDELVTMLQPLGSAGPDLKQIAPGGTSVVYLWIALDSSAPIPARLVHRAVLANATAEGAIVSTHTAPLPVLRPPLEGQGWLAGDGPGNSPDNHHRRGLIVIDGAAVDSRRFAIDWLKARNDADYAGDPRDFRSYFAYGQAVVAVADATVVAARDGLPNNVPGHNDDFHPAIPITLDTVGGNTVTLDLGGGQYAYYFHLAPGSVRVKVGDHVGAGQLLGLVGASGDAREPHLHFELTNSRTPLAGEGLPYLIDSYNLESSQGLSTQRRSLPLNNMVVDFGTPHK